MMATASVVEEPWQHQRPSKRKAEVPDNERLSKRMSLLNLGMQRRQSTLSASSSVRLLTPLSNAEPAPAQKRYHLRRTVQVAATARHAQPPRLLPPSPVTIYPTPAETLAPPNIPPEVAPESAVMTEAALLLPIPTTTGPVAALPPQLLPSQTIPAAAGPQSLPPDDEGRMRLDDTRYKVYIYDLDAELASLPSSSRSASPDPNDTTATAAATGERLHLLQADLAAHLQRTRREQLAAAAPAVVPRPVPTAADGTLAGVDVRDMQLVLYDAAGPEGVRGGEDPARRAIMEARERARERSAAAAAATATAAAAAAAVPARPRIVAPAGGVGEGAGASSEPEYDPDAMDCDP